MTRDRGWSSLHIYFHSDQDVLLLRCIRPLADRLKSEGVAERLFFLRHWVQGPHIRLRILPRDGLAFGPLSECVAARIINDLTIIPSCKELDRKGFLDMAQHFAALEQEAQGSGDLQPDNSVRIQDYVPEFEKYGGRVGLSIAEDVFDVSTDCSLQSLPKLASAYEVKLGHAYLMMVQAIVAFGIVPHQMPQFLQTYQRIWSRYRSPGADTRWGKILEANRPRLERVAAAILTGKGAGPIAERWADAIRTAAVAIGEHAGEVFAHSGGAAMDEPKRWQLLMQYLHTHNNRLGIAVGDEGFLAFIGDAVLRRLIGQGDGAK